MQNIVLTDRYSHCLFWFLLEEFLISMGMDGVIIFLENKEILELSWGSKIKCSIDCLLMAIGMNIEICSYDRLSMNLGAL